MKKAYKYLVAVGIAAISTLAVAKDYVVLTFADGTTRRIEVTADDKIVLAEKSFSLQGRTYQFSDITNVGFEYEEDAAVDPSEDANVIYVTWNGSEAPTVKCSAPGVSVNVNGQNVTLTNENVDTEYTYVLDGQSDEGSFTLVADYKSSIELRGLSLHSALEEALNIKCGKRVALMVADGTENTLSDATVDSGQKGALYCKGHLEVSGAGTLNVLGNVKHGLSTKEYLQLKKSFTGVLNVTGAAKDGIHAGQYFQMNGGTVSISGTGGDGIQAEATSDAADEDNGKIIIKGGQLDITTSVSDVAALKSDSLMTISGGTFTLTTKGSADKALKSSTDICISGGEFTITQSGSYIVENMDASYTTAIKAENVTISGGTFNITNTAEAGKGISADKSLVIDESSASVCLNIKANGAGGQFDPSKNVETDQPTVPDDEPSYKVYVNVPASTGEGGPGGWGGKPGGETSNTWSTVYLCSSNGTQIATLTQRFTVNGVEFRCYDFGEATMGTYYFSAPNYNNWGQNYSIRSAQFSLDNSDGKARFYQITSSYSSSGSTRTYPINDVTSTYEGGTITEGTATSGSNVSATCLKSDGSVTIKGGSVTLSSSGQAGKGIKADGNIYIGNEADKTGPRLSIITTGSRISTGGGSSAKAVKCDGCYYQYGGDIYIETNSDGAEGIESKTKATKSLNFIGGNIFMKVYDDCINSAGQICFDGANVICYSTGNDAIDSNYGQNQSIIVSAGNVVAFSQRGGAEMGIDADAINRVYVSGGTLITGGGNQGGSSGSSIGTGSTHNRAWSSSVSYTANRYYSIVCKGENIITWQMPCTVSSTMNIYASDQFTSSTTHTIYEGTSAPTSGTTHDFHSSSTAESTTMIWEKSNITSGTSKGTFSPS